MTLLSSDSEQTEYILKANKRAKTSNKNNKFIIILTNNGRKVTTTISQYVF
jgi:hypothetical protein